MLVGLKKVGKNFDRNFKNLSKVKSAEILVNGRSISTDFFLPIMYLRLILHDITSRTFFSQIYTTLIKRDRKLSLAMRNIFHNFTDRQTHFKVAHRHKNVVSIESLMIRKSLQKSPKREVSHPAVRVPIPSYRRKKDADPSISPK